MRQAGFEVLYTAELSPASTDEEVLACANADNALLLTADKDFGEIIYRMGLVHNGVILLRLCGLSPEVRCDHVLSVLKEHAAELENAFTVISPGTVRIRHPVRT